MSAQTESKQIAAASRQYTRLEWLESGCSGRGYLIFLAFMSLGFAPTLLPELFNAVRIGSIPGVFLVYALILALVPVFAVVLREISLPLVYGTMQ